MFTLKKTYAVTLITIITLMNSFFCSDENQFFEITTIIPLHAHSNKLLQIHFRSLAEE